MICGLEFLKGNTIRELPLLWKSLHHLWPILLQNMVTALGDGANTLFWQDRWLSDDLCLNDWCPVEASLADRYALVKDFVLPLGE